MEAVQRDLVGIFKDVEGCDSVEWEGRLTVLSREPVECSKLVGC